MHHVCVCTGEGEGFYFYLMVFAEIVKQIQLVASAWSALNTASTRTITIGYDDVIITSLVLLLNIVSVNMYVCMYNYYADKLLHGAR